MLQDTVRRQKGANAAGGKQLLVWNLWGNIDSGPIPFLNTVTRMGSRCAQVPRAADGGTTEGSDISLMTNGSGNGFLELLYLAVACC